MKKLLITFIISVVWFIGFWNCLLLEPITAWKQINWNSSITASPWFCYKSNSTYYRYFKFTENWTDYTLPSNAYTYCFWTTWTVSNTNSSQISYTFYDISSILWSSYTSEQCQQEYSLMPISSCDSEYCELNNLCEVIGWSWSSTLYINDIWHESAPFIYVNIPDEFKWDYLTWEQEFTINVEWLNGDSDYIQWIIDVNSYRPSSEDFTQIFVGGLTLIFPYIIITAIIIFIRRFIKKLFS